MSLLNLFNSAFLYIVYGIVLVSLLVVLWMKWTYTYWKRRGIVTPPVSLFYGNFKDNVLQKKSFFDSILSIYKIFKEKGLKHGGIYVFHAPNYVPLDLKVIKNILQNDFSHFLNRGVYINEERDPLSLNLFGLEGAKWKHQRSQTTPMFTSAKTKMMFQTAIKSADHLEKALTQLVEENQTPLDFKEISRKFTVDITGNVVYGIEQNILSDPDNDMIKFGKRLFRTTRWENFKRFVGIITPATAKFFNLKCYPKEVDDYFLNLTDSLIEHRWRNNISRPDFLDMLVQLRKRGGIDVSDEKSDNTESPLSFNELASQAFLFLASNETVSSTATFTIYSLATNPHIQDKVREEIHRCLDETDGILTYDLINKMEYLDHCVDESLRMFPPFPLLMRQCIKDYKIPDSDLVLEKGVHVYIPSVGLHYDPEYFPNPEVYDPDRFTKENKEKRSQFCYLPFGLGPRQCIAQRFGKMQVKIAVVTVINKFKISLSDKTNNPLVSDPTETHTSVLGGVWINMEPLKKSQ